LNPHWTISAADASEPCVAEVGHESDVLHRHRAVGSRLYQDFAAQPERIDRFFQPHHEFAAAHLATAANPRRDPWL
jgi:hypothetical protein